MDRDVQAGVADRLAAGAEAARVAELGEDRDRGELADAVEPHQRLAAGLAARVAAQLGGDRRLLGVERVDHRQRDRDLLARRVRQRDPFQPRAVRGPEQAVFLRVPVVIEDRVDALLPLAALIDEAVTQPDPRAQIEQVLRRDVGLRQPPRHQQLAQVPRVGPVGLRALLVALQRARLGRLGQMRLGADRGQLLDHEPPAGRGLQRDLELLAGKARQEPSHAIAIGRHHPRARDLTGLGIQPLRSDLRPVLIQTHHDRHGSLLEPGRGGPAPARGLHAGQDDTRLMPSLREKRYRVTDDACCRSSRRRSTNQTKGGEGGIRTLGRG